MSALPGSTSAEYPPTTKAKHRQHSSLLTALCFPGRPLSFLTCRCSERRPHSLTILMSTMRSLRFPVPTLTVLYNTRIAYHVHCCFHSSPFRLRCRCARPCLALVVTAERPQVSCLPLRRPPCPPSLPTLPPALLSGLSCICIAFSFCVFLIALSNLCMLHFPICFLDAYYLPRRDSRTRREFELWCRAVVQSIIGRCNISLSNTA